MTIESTQKRFRTSKNLRERRRIKKSDDVERRERITRDDDDARVFTKICMSLVCVRVRAFSRERDERKCPAFCVIPVVIKTGDFLSILLQKKKKDDDDDDDGDLSFLLLDDDDDDHVLRVAVLATQRWW